MVKSRTLAIVTLLICVAVYAYPADALNFNGLNLSALVDRNKLVKGRPKEAWSSPLGDTNIDEKQANDENKAAADENKEEIAKINKQAEEDKQLIRDSAEKKSKKINNDSDKKVKEAEENIADLVSRNAEIEKIIAKRDKDLEAVKADSDERCKAIDEEATSEITLINKGGKIEDALNSASQKVDNIKNKLNSIMSESGSAETVSEDNEKNRCRLIKLIKPGEGKVEEMQRVATILQAYYSSELYTQAMQTLYELDQEEQHPFTNESSEKAILDKNIRDVLLDMAQRLSVVASLEARVAVVDNISKLIALSPDTYNDIVCEEQKQSADTGKENKK